MMDATDHGTTVGDLIKMTVELTPVDWHGHATETMWAKPAGDDRFIIQNIPFYAYDLSYDDVVTGSFSDGRWRVVNIAKRGGHSTYRLFVTNTEALLRFDEFWDPLARIGCTCERATQRLIAVDVPPNTDIYAAYDLLQAGETAHVWNFEEGHVGHTLRH